MADDLQQKLDNMGDYKVTTVADLVNALAGLPPMMEVWAQFQDLYLFVNNVTVEKDDSIPAPVLVISSNTVPIRTEFTSESYDEELAKKRQQAMQMAHNSDEASKMPDMVK